MRQGGQKSTPRSRTQAEGNPTLGPSTVSEKLAPSIRRTAKPAEKQVRKTDKTLDVAPPKQGREARKPVKGPAIDQRREIVGTDDPKGQSAAGSPGDGKRAEVASGFRSGNKPRNQRTPRT